VGLLDGKVAIVTAAAGAGIGQAAARRFAQEGAQLVVSDAHPRRVEEVGEAIAKETGREVLALAADVRDAAQVQSMVQAALDRFGRVDVLMNNAGINRLSPVWEMDDETWRLVIDVNLTGTFLCTREVLPHMIEQRSGAIVNMASVVGWFGSSDGEAHYAAAKAGVMGFTRAVASEVGHHGGARERDRTRADLQRVPGAHLPARLLRPLRAAGAAGARGRAARRGRPGALPRERPLALHHGRGDLHQRRRLHGALNLSTAVRRPARRAA